MQLQEVLCCKRAANINAVVTYFRSFLPLLTKIKNLSKLYVPLNVLIDTSILISVLVKCGQLFFIYSELLYVSTGEQEPFTRIVKNSGTSHLQSFFQGAPSLSFSTFLLLSFSPPTPPRPAPKMLATDLKGFGKTDSQLIAFTNIPLEMDCPNSDCHWPVKNQRGVKSFRKD